jgi:hypothetical protein
VTIDIAKSAQTVPGALEILWQQRVFRDAKNLGAIREELSRRGYNFNEAHLAKALTRCKFLTRRGSRGAYAYIQKFPPGEDSQAQGRRE